MIVNKGDTVTAKRVDWRDWHSIYRSVIMPSISQIDIHKYKMKLEKRCGCISIGIDDAECKHQDGDFEGSSLMKL